MKKRLLKNTALLTGASALSSLIALLFRLWLAGQIGAAGIGLFQLIVSVDALAATLAIAGLRFATTRLVAEELGADRRACVPAAMRLSLGFAALSGLAAALLLILVSGPVSLDLIHDGRCLRPLQLSAFSLPCVSLTAALSGYFTACGRLLRPTLIRLAEQLAGAALTVFFLRRAAPGDVEAGCAAVVCGQLLAALLSLLLLALVYAGDRARHFPAAAALNGQGRRLLRIALPLALSACARSGLNTVQQLLVPRGLRSGGFSAERALAGYGVVQGMALPVLLFPSCLLYSAAELIVPELTKLQQRREQARIRRAVRGFLQGGILYAAAVAALAYRFAYPLSVRLYGSAEAGLYLRRLSPLVLVMYADVCVDGCLKGLGQQVWSMGVNVVDSLSALLLTLFLLPRWGLPGYLWMIYATETLNFLLSLGRLLTVRRAAPAEAARSLRTQPAQTA